MTEKSGSTVKIVFLIVLLVLGGLFIAGYLVLNSTTGGKIIVSGDEAPEFSLPSSEGGPVNLRDLRGRVVMVHFWATWCPSCVEELPTLDTLYLSLKGKDFEMLAVSVDEGGAGDVASFIRKNRLNIPVLFDPRSDIAALYGTFKFPETYILDRSGVVRYKAIGPKDWNDPQYIRIVRDIIEAR